MEERKKLMAECRQIIVKAGTRLLTDPESIPQLIHGIALLRKKGYQVLLVSSGAVGTGLKLLKKSKRPRKLAEIQALAALGQGQLMAEYNAACAKEGFLAAQLLLTRDDLRHRDRYLNVQNCIQALWNHNILPIVNENDSVSVAELKFSDNDILSGMLAAMTQSQLTVILTTESGLRRRENGVLTDRISVVSDITDEILGMAGGTDDPTFSIGGMASKLNAAMLATRAGGHLWIADGRHADVLKQIANGEDIGTLFLPQEEKLHSRKLWIDSFAEVCGRIVVDEGAAKALIQDGSSLLPSGVKQVHGHFDAGDAVEIVTRNGNPVGRGLANFSSEDCYKIRGLRAAEVTELLGSNAPAEVIHRDKLSLCRQDGRS